MPQSRSAKSEPSAKAASGVTAVFVYDKETPNSVRYGEEVENGKSPVIGTYVYIKKTLYKKFDEPEAIEVTIKPADEE